MNHSIKYVSLLSIDVAIGAVCSAVFAGHIVHGITLDWYHLSTLFFAVIGIYTFDHIFDINRIEPNVLSPRRLFHLRHKSLLIGGMIVSLIIAAILSWFLPHKVQRVGAVIAILMGLYFFIMARFNTQKIKDIGVSFGYAVGIWLPIWASAEHWPPIGDWLVFSLFMVNTLQIMMVYAKVDAFWDRQESIESFVQSHKWFVWLVSKLGYLFSLILMLSIFSLKGEDKWIVIFPLLQFVLIRFVTKKRIKNLTPETVRVLGEYSFVIYVLIVFFR